MRDIGRRRVIAGRPAARGGDELAGRQTPGIVFFQGERVQRACAGCGGGEYGHTMARIAPGDSRRSVCARPWPIADVAGI
jgi:hypothetical protein